MNGSTTFRDWNNSILVELKQEKANLGLAQQLSSLAGEVMVIEFQLKVVIDSIDAKVQAATSSLQLQIAKLQKGHKAADAHIQVLDARLQTLEARVQTLEARVQTLEARVQTLEESKVQRTIKLNVCISICYLYFYYHLFSKDTKLLIDYLHGIVSAAEK